MRIPSILLMTSLVMASSCKKSDDRTHTLYRTASGDPAVRIHVATFDADEEAAYNKENCEIAQGLFQQNRGASVKYWCEPGAFRDLPK